MKVYKTRQFKRWSDKEKLSDTALKQAVEEMNQGLVEANLGGHVYKKRIATQGKGKRSSARTLLAFKVGGKAFFMYGFSKNTRDNIKADELSALKVLANDLLNASTSQLEHLVRIGKLLEVSDDE